ncbi:lecithin retinol acyltransferase family protein [Phytobacter sp. V91]|uniref:lecithin retinol acyltransferase family protein n=1 Tax=Phytobacter sp. V91 TaxID=3369425 RepID=UPI003F6442B6
MITAGDHLSSSRTGYTHHGIYVGYGKVVHYSGLADGLSKGNICETTLEDFTQGKETVTVIKHDVSDRLFSPEEIVERARTRIGENNYNLVFNNCEHFATWCVTGKHRSAQVQAVSSSVVNVSLAYRTYQTWAATNTPTLLRSVASLSTTTTTTTSAIKGLSGISALSGGASITGTALTGGAAGTGAVVGVLAAAPPVALAVGGIALVGVGAKLLYDWWND